MTINVTITFSDRSDTFPIWHWERVQSHDIQKVEWRHSVSNIGGQLQGHSIYWCYPINGGAQYVFGNAAVRYSLKPLTELIVDVETGQVTRRDTEHMPDLFLPQVKLGWWRVVDG